VTGTPPEALPLASFKLHFVQRRARILPARDASGCAFTGPGIDLVGVAADQAIALAAPLVRWLEAREPVRVRSLSLDVGRGRFLISLEESPKPRVVKIDPGIDAGASAELLHLSAPLLRHLGEVARAKLAARSAGQH
jgi:hypothetical protein